MSSLSWLGDAPSATEVVNLGPLALIEPLLDKLNVAAIIDQHLPPDPQLEYSHGQVLTLLLAARLCQPTALMNVGAWAEKTGADLLYNLPADKLNDDRLGRALDAFFTQRHSILASVTAQALDLTGLSLERLHFDPTHVLLSGAYESSMSRPPTADPLLGNGDLPAAHICHGYTDNVKRIQLGQLAAVDDRGAVPVFAHCYDGNRNGHTGSEELFELLRRHIDLPDRLLMISDRGTCSIEHLARLHRHGYEALCPGTWQDYRALYDTHAERLHWQQASYLSIEQRRRRDTNSSLPREHYELAVLTHNFRDPSNQQEIPGRLIFVYSTADERDSRDHRTKNIARIRTGLENLQAKLARGHPQCTYATIARQVCKLLGRKAAARYFHWQLIPLTAAEQAALPSPARGHVKPTHRLHFSYDAAAARDDERYDGLSVLLATASLRWSADGLFTQYKGQNYLELLHHQIKTPLAVSPIFLKSPVRVQALVCLLQLALQAYQILERLYRQNVPADASRDEQRMTTERMLRLFSTYGLVVDAKRIGRVVHPTRLNTRQKQILPHLHFRTPQQTLTHRLPREPSD